MTAKRKMWLDWERGLAVLFMIEVHTLYAWLAGGAGRGRLYDVLTMLGGFAAPSFLFMAGLSQTLADAARQRRRVPTSERRRAGLRRALWLLGVAYLFRISEYILGGAYRVPRGWEDILRVDILNVIAIALGASAVIVIGAPRRAQPWLGAVACAAIVFATPAVAGWNHSPNRVLDYLWATWPRANFSLFNWAGFLFAGSALGNLAAGRERPLVFLAIGAALFAGGLGADQLPPVYAHQDFWRTSPSWFAMRLGGVVALAGALQLLPEKADRFLSWLRTLGRHSLLGYVASVELTYGLATAALHKALSLDKVLAGLVAMIAVTWGLAVAADRYVAWRSAQAASASTSPAP